MSAARQAGLPTGMIVLAATASAADGGQPQQASWHFFLPVTLAYLVACAGWLGLTAARPGVWPRAEAFEPRRPWVALGVALLVVLGVLAVGRAYAARWLIPELPGRWWVLSYNANMLIVFSPLFAALAWRREGPASVYCAPRGAGIKAATGLVLGLLAVAVYLALRGELGRFGAVLAGTVSLHALGHALAVFLEGVGLAYLFVRLRGALGHWPAILGPALLFALAHVPRQLEDERGLAEIAAFFVLNTLLPAAILWTVVRARDVIWIGVVHYLMDVAIRAFD